MKASNAWTITIANATAWTQELERANNATIALTASAKRLAEAYVELVRPDASPRRLRRARNSGLRRR